MARGAIFLILLAASLGGAHASAQTTQINPPAVTQPKSDNKSDDKPDDATSGIGQHNPADPAEDSRADQGRLPTDNGPPANPPSKDETVGSGSSVDRAPRDIRHPFDE